MALLNATTASFAFTGQTIPASECASVSVEGLGKRTRNVTPIGWVSERHMTTIGFGRGSVGFFVDSATTPIIPNGTNGTLTITFTSGKTHAFPAILTFMGYSMNGPAGNEQVANYAWQLSATASTSTITVV